MALSSLGPAILSQVLDGKWRVDKALADGGMGHVFIARDLALDRDVAVKFLSSKLVSDPKAMARFEREAKVMARLDHPNLVPIHAFGRHQGVPFMVMKRVPGMDLGAWVKANGLPSLPSVQLLIGQLLDGLGHLHQHGIVHRDVKPTNIIVGDNSQVTLLDFGIAHENNGETMTPTGSAVGTPRYMAPEQALDATVDHRADIYAVGVLLYELLTGHRLYEGRTDLELLRAHVETPAPDPHDSNPTLPGHVSAAVLRALAKRPEERFSTAAELKQALVGSEEASAPALSPRSPTTPAPALHEARVTQVLAETGPDAPTVLGQAPVEADGAKRKVVLLSAALVVVAAVAGVGLTFGRGGEGPRQHASESSGQSAKAQAPQAAAAIDSGVEPLATDMSTPSADSGAHPDPPSTGTEPPKGVEAEEGGRRPRSVRYGTLHVILPVGSTHTWARCTIDGRDEKVVVPKQFNLPAGQHRLDCVGRDEKTFSKTVTVVAGNLRQVEISFP